MIISTLSWCFIDSYVFFFFFKQKTAYEMRISDWSSDVCSSDLTRIGKRARHARHRAFYQVGAGALDRGVDRGALAALPLVLARRLDAREPGFPPEQRFGIAALARALQRVADRKSTRLNSSH